MIYRFTFDPDGSPQVVDDPINWNDSELSIERDNDIKGIFYQYTANLEWVGSAYSYIDALDTASDCWEFDVLIEFKVNPDDAFQTLFNGRIYSYDVEFDLQKQIAKCKIVDQNLTQIILDRQDISVNSGATKSLDGTAITGLVPTEVSLNSVKIDFSSSGTVKMYFVSDIFSHMISYITNNQVVFESDWFESDDNQVAIWNIQPGGIGVSFTITIVSEIGTFTATQAFNTSNERTIVSTFAEIARNSSVTGFEFDMGAPFQLVINGANDYDIYSAFDIISVTTVGGTSNTTSKVQDTTQGMSNLMMIKGNAFRFNYAGTDITATISNKLSILTREMNRLFDMTFKIFDDGGQPTMKLEKTENFFDQASAASVTITGVRNISVKRNNDFKLNSINHQDGADDYKSDTASYSSSFRDYFVADLNTTLPKGYQTTEQCGQGSFNAQNEFITSNQAIDSLQENETDFDQDTILIDTFDDSGTQRAKEYPITPSLVANLLITAFKTFNAFLGTLWRQKYWMTSTGKQATSGGVQFDNDTIILDKEYEFTTPISQVDINAIVADPAVKISVSGEGLTATDMWILSMSVDIKTGLVQFKTISNE